MAKIESRSEKPEFFAKGGSGKMFGKAPLSASTARGIRQGQHPARWRCARSGPKCGSGKMFGKRPSQQRQGRTIRQRKPGKQASNISAEERITKRLPQHAQWLISAVAWLPYARLR